MLSPEDAYSCDDFLRDIQRQRHVAYMADKGLTECYRVTLPESNTQAVLTDRGTILLEAHRETVEITASELVACLQLVSRDRGTSGRTREQFDEAQREGRQ